MPNTAKGTPYVQGSDLVSAYPTVSSNLATHIDDNLSYNAVTINAQSGTTYTFVLADASAGKLVTASNAGSQTYTVPPQSSVTWADGAVLRILNQGAGVVTIAAGAGVTINGTPLTLNQYAGAALQRTASNTWTLIPFTGGVGNADFSDAATGTYTSGGINYKYITYTASGTLNVTSAGLCDILVVAGGGGGALGGGGAGGHLYVTSAYLSAATPHTITVGAGGAANNSGIASRCGDYFSPGGGAGAFSVAANPNGGGNGGSGGGGRNTVGGGAGISGLGNNGGSPPSVDIGGGGGGAGAVGGNGSGTTGGNGGAGIANSITNSSVTRCGGGGGGGATPGTGGTGGGGGAGNPATAGSANTGGGGGGNYNTGVGGAGGSGVVIVRVRTA